MKIVKRSLLVEHESSRIARLEIHSPRIAEKAMAGQFIVLMVSEKGERIPLTIVDTDKKQGLITIIFQVAGHTTELLSKMKEGDSLYSLAGPLGHRTDVKEYGTVILVGGGVGIAEIYPVAKAFKGAGNRVLTIIGARSKMLLILEKELKTISDELHIVTDDGSCGKKGFVTDVLGELLSKKNSGGCALVYAVGPIPMMRAVSNLTNTLRLKTIVSLNALMVDATGMCGCCRVTVEGKTRFSCVDGPEFDAHLVDWEELSRRNTVYTREEKHICKLDKLS